MGEPVEFGSGELQFDLSRAPPHRTDDDFHVVPQLGYQLKKLGFADATELSSSNARNLGLIETEQRSGTFLR